MTNTLRLSSALALSLALAFTGGCKKKEGEAPAPAAKTAPTAAEPAAAAPAAPAAPAAAEPAAAAPATTPVKIEAKALFAEFTKPDADGLALLDKYAGGATFTAPAKTVGAEESGTPVVALDAGDGNIIMLGWKDAADPKAKAIKVGDAVTVTCKIGGAMDKLMQVTDCTF